MWTITRSCPGLFAPSFSLEFIWCWGKGLGQLWALHLHSVYDILPASLASLILNVTSYHPWADINHRDSSKGSDRKKRAWISPAGGKPRVTLVSPSQVTPKPLLLSFQKQVRREGSGQRCAGLWGSGQGRALVWMPVQPPRQSCPTTGPAREPPRPPRLRDTMQPPQWSACGSLWSSCEWHSYSDGALWWMFISCFNGFLPFSQESNYSDSIKNTTCFENSFPQFLHVEEVDTED